MTDLRTEPCPDDPVFHQPGQVRHRDLDDRLFGVPGRWHIRARADIYWLDPMPLRDDILHAYVNYHTHDDEQTTPSDGPARADWYYTLREKVWATEQPSTGSQDRHRIPWQAWLPPVREQLRFDRGFLPVLHKGKLLDIGCGSGGLVERLNRLGWDSQGIDPDPQAVEIARSLNRPVSRAGVEELPQMANELDAATLFHVIEHIHDPIKVLQDVHHLLKPGGRVVLVTPNARSLVSRIFGRHWRGLEPPRHLQVFTRRSLARALKEAGFVDISVATSFRDASGMFCASHAIRHNQASAPTITPPRRVRLLGDATLAVEWLLTRFGLPVGEELVAVARRI